jgi:hypothetical protein
MTNLVSIALFSVGFLGMCAFTQAVVDYVCKLFNLREELAE